MKPRILTLSALLIFSSCKNQSSSPTQPSASNDAVTVYYPLNSGDTWVYEMFAADTSFNFTSENDSDIVSIGGDSLLGGTKYKIVNSSRWGVSLIRDSANYIVDQSGWKMFTNNGTSDYLVNQYQPYSDSTLYNTAVVRSSDSTCVVPAGTFQARFTVGTITSTIPRPPALMKNNYYFAFSKNVGLILKRMIYSDANNDFRFIEERLVRYHITLNTN